MKIKKQWAMPNKKTFDIKPITEFIEKHITMGLWLDPFSNQSRFYNRQQIKTDILSTLKGLY